MLYYDKIDISKGNDPTKSNKSGYHMICHYFFFNHGFKFQDYVCNRCHDFEILSVYIKSIVLNFSRFFFLLFLFSIYKMVDSMRIHKSININTGTVIKNPGIPKLVPDHLKTKQMHALKKLPYILRYVPNLCKT